jgi:hypothetical protein
MSTTSDLYLARAADAAQQAAATTLANVKESCLRSEAAWQAMADRAIRAETMRDAARPGEGSAA